jgi:SAM-dependent methyltransferase
VKRIIDKIYYSRFFSSIFHTTVFCLKKELQDCESVLDLGCGPSSPLQYCKSIKYSVGVEIFRPYLEESKKRKIHTEYVEKRVEEVDFPEKKFDAVVLIEVLEHLSKEKGYEILKKADKWAKKKVIVSTPNGYMPQRERDGNPLQKHLSGWDKKTMEELSFKCRGLAGWKFLHSEYPNEETEDDFTASIRFKPRLFWFFIATLSQLITYLFPKYAFEIFCVYPVKSSLREVSASSGEFNRVKKFNEHI